MGTRGAGPRSRAGTRLWVLAACGPLMLLSFGVVSMATGVHGDLGDAELVENLYPNLVFGSLGPLLGALILSRIPGQAIGRLYLSCGLVSAATFPVFGYAHLALIDFPETLPGGLAFAWLSSWLWAWGFMPLVTLSVLLFPDGQPPTPRWRWLVWLSLCAPLATTLGIMVRPGPFENHPGVDNPVGLGLPTGVFDVVQGLGFVMFLVALAGSVVSAFVRWRRAGPAERAQLNWFVLAVGLIAVGLVAPVPDYLGYAIIAVAVPLLPISVAVAILRQNLYGIEVAVRRSLIYGTLTVLLLVMYAVAVGGLGLLLEGRADSAAALVATALVAIAFAPARSRLQRSADRLLYGDRRNPYAVLAGVGRSLEGDGADTTSALAEVAETVASSLRLPYAYVEVTDGSTEPLTASWGKAAEPFHVVPLTFRGAPVGRLVVAGRSSVDRFSTKDLRLLDDLGRQIGVAGHAMLLGQALQRSREGLVATREDERRRIRRDLHDGLGPALAGVALGLDALNRIAVDDPVAAAELADQLRAEVQSSLTDVRRLVEDLRPPALDQLGLVGALQQQADRLSERDTGLAVTVRASTTPPLPQLPAAVEVAAFRIASEALNNVSRHARARRCQLGIALADGHLVVEVEDDGVGLPVVGREGVGLSAMLERATELGGTCETTSVPGAGTRVTARLPLPETGVA